MENMNDMNNMNQSTSMEPVSKEERMWATFCHLAGFAGLIIPVIGQILGPLIIWLIKKDESLFVEKEGREALNFQISCTIYFFVCSILIIAIVGMFLLPVVFIFWVIATIISAVKSNNGQHTHYPLTIRFI